MCSYAVKKLLSHSLSPSLDPVYTSRGPFHRRS